MMDGLLKMKNLKKCFKRSKSQGCKIRRCKIKMEGFPKEEIIINDNENFDRKLQYYEYSYDKNLTLKTFDGIKIVGFTYGDNFEEIEKDLIG